MAQFVRAFLKDHFDHRDVKEQQYNYYCVEKGYDSQRVAEVIWKDPKFPEKPGNLRNGLINQKEWDDALELARKELGDAIVDLAEKEFDKEKEEKEADKKDREALGKEMAAQDKSAVTRINPGSKSNQVQYLLPRLVKCVDQEHILVHPLDAKAAMDAGLEALFIRFEPDEGEEVGPIMALKRFSSGDEPEFFWKADPKMFHAKMTPYALYKSQGLWKGDKVWMPWTAELHEDPDEDIKEMEEEFEKYKKERKGPGKYEEKDDAISPEEEWLSEQKGPELVKWCKQLDDKQANAEVAFVR